MRKLLILVLLVGIVFAQKPTTRTPEAGDYVRILDSNSMSWDQTLDQILNASLDVNFGTQGSALINSANVGAVHTTFANSGTVTAIEYGDGYNHITVLTLTGIELGEPDAGNALAFGDTLYTFPEGIQVVEWFMQNVALTAVGETGDTPELGIGSIVATGAQATLGAAGATMEDYSVGAAVDSCGGTSEAVGPIGATAGIFTGIALNDTSKVKSVCLNVADTWHASVTDSLIASGTVSFKWTTLE